MMVKHGSIGEFRQEVEEWSMYAERLEHYIAANDVAAEDKNRAILLSMCGPSTYVLIRSLVTPQKPTDFCLRISWRRSARTTTCDHRRWSNTSSSTHGRGSREKQWLPT